MTASTLAGPRLDPAFLTVPIAHRALHDRDAGIIENSRAAIKAAVRAGYGIEIDVQMAADGEAMVFHDDELLRLTGRTGPVRGLSARDLGGVVLSGGSGDGDHTIPTLEEVLSLVAGQVPLLVEIKDQSRVMAPTDGRLERRTARLVQAYPGPVALMSFNPHAVAHCRDAAPDIPRGRVTDPFQSGYWSAVPPERRVELARIDDLHELGASFISHYHGDLASAEVAAAKEMGADVLTWTIRSEAEEAAARVHAANITFERYLAERPTDHDAPP